MCDTVILKSDSFRLVDTHINLHFPIKNVCSLAETISRFAVQWSTRNAKEDEWLANDGALAQLILKCICIFNSKCYLWQTNLQVIFFSSLLLFLLIFFVCVLHSSFDMQLPLVCSHETTCLKHVIPLNIHTRMLHCILVKWKLVTNEKPKGWKK